MFVAIVHLEVSGVLDDVEELMCRTSILIHEEKLAGLVERHRVEEHCVHLFMFTCNCPKLTDCFGSVGIITGVPSLVRKVCLSLMMFFTHCVSLAILIFQWRQPGLLLEKLVEEAGIGKIQSLGNLIVLHVTVS